MEKGYSDLVHSFQKMANLQEQLNDSVGQYAKLQGRHNEILEEPNYDERGDKWLKRSPLIGMGLGATGGLLTSRHGDRIPNALIGSALGGIAGSLTGLVGKSYNNNKTEDLSPGRSSRLRHSNRAIDNLAGGELYDLASKDPGAYEELRATNPSLPTMDSLWQSSQDKAMADEEERFDLQERVRYNNALQRQQQSQL